jgi:DNA repair protein RecN (Recombination protein N)
MLNHLKIQNIAIIEEVSIDFGGGFNILTGETGAGKSILIDSLNAVLGQRTSKDLVRTGKTQAFIEAMFKIKNCLFTSLFEEFGILPEEDGTLILQREIHQNGKNICRVNGRLLNVSALKQFGEKLVDIHGQHDNQSLLKPEKHIHLLDSFALEDLKIEKENYLSLLENFRSLKKEIADLNLDPGYRERRMDILTFQIEEIENAGLKLGEDLELQQTRNLLSNAQKIGGVLDSLYGWLFQHQENIPSAYDHINQSIKELATIRSLDPSYQELYSKLEEISFQLEDCIETLRIHQDPQSFSSQHLEQVDERLDLISRLKRKYGNSIEEILLYLESLKEEHAKILNSEEVSKKLHEKLNSHQQQLYAMAIGLHQKRKKEASLLEEKIAGELNDLEIKNASFKVDLTLKEMDEQKGYPFSKNGLCQVEFLISTNLGEPLKPLSKIASGGEMSRIMLAIKTILAKIDQTPTLIFDEVDSGISGSAANKVGTKLSLLSNSYQVICITHLAQIASMADHHFFIQKNVNSNKTYTHIKKLQEDDLISEIARLSGGDTSSKITLKHAQEMLEKSKTNG